MESNRFWEKVSFRWNMRDCWNWTAHRSVKGYGRFRPSGGRLVMAHRWSFESEREVIPDGKYLDHLCRNRACVNPAHLEVVTNAENMRRGRITAARAAQQRAKTHCPSGHEYTAQNTYTHRGQRHCRACNAINAKKRYYDKKSQDVRA